MIELSQMLVRFAVALILGGLLGLERELVGKEAGIRTGLTVAGGAAIFAIIAVSLPYIIATSPAMVPDILARNSGFLTIIANIVVGIGFLGAGTIIKTEERAHGLTTAAVIWATAAVGTLAGIGLLEFAAIATIIFTVILYALRGLRLEPVQKSNKPQ